jgi:hypothetical protein
VDSRTRRVKEMGERVLDWSTAHPDPDPGSVAGLNRLQQLVTRVNELADRQRDGILEVRRATARKRTMREEITQVHLSHTLSAAELASVEEPELAEKFRVPGRVRNYAAFRTAARGVLTEAESRKDLLMKHGLSESVLVALRKDLDEFDAVVERGAQGRAMHVGASTELDHVCGEILLMVKVMNGGNRFRLAQDGELLSAWRSISSVVAAPKREPEAPGSTGQAPPDQSHPAA